MSKISDRTWVLMRDRWAASIRPEHRHAPDWWKRTNPTTCGDIIAAPPSRELLNDFWSEFVKPAGWTE